MTRIWRMWMIFLCGMALAHGHVVSQFYGEWREEPQWELEIWFDAGYAVPELRGDADGSAPERKWLAELGEPGWTGLREEAERYLRESLSISWAGGDLKWSVDFPDFETSPPDFPVRLNDGAYFRMRLGGDEPVAGTISLAWADGDRPNLVLRLPGEEVRYLSFRPGDRSELDVGGSMPWMETFRQGFLHVVPDGLDHVLFVMGLFFYRRAWRPLVLQSLAFTVAHTVTLGLAAAGRVSVPEDWVEPLIALSLVAVALENLRARKDKSEWPRLLVVFVFGLIHGLGFAGALSAWLPPGEGFMTALISSNIGVEAAQVAILALAWVLTLRWHRTRAYRVVRIAGCLLIAGIGGFWTLERVGLLG